MIHRARKMSPDAVIVAAGCYVQARGDELEEGIDIVIGNNKKQELAGILEHYWQEREKRGRQTAVQKEIVDIGHTSEYEELHLTHTGEHTRAYIKVQDGCNQFCSYCIIPYARGRVRSRKREDVVREVKELAKGGYKEVVLTGIHLSSYGIDQEDNLLNLIQAVHEVEEYEGSGWAPLEPRIIRGLCEDPASLPKICPHFHLSLQSGCDETLKRMNRRYTSEEYYEKCCLLRKYFQDPALTTDVIVGFPGETEEEFEKSRDFIDKVNFYETHIFKYSRQGTKGCRFMDRQMRSNPKCQSARLIVMIRRRRKRKRLRGRAAYRHQQGSAYRGVCAKRRWYLSGRLYSGICESRTKNARKFGKSVDKCRN